jgi:hypothetical protein
VKVNELMHSLDVLRQVDMSDDVYAFIYSKEDAEGLLDPWMEQDGYALSEEQWVELVDEIRAKCYSLILDLVSDVVIDYVKGESSDG